MFKTALISSLLTLSFTLCGNTLACSAEAGASSNQAPVNITAGQSQQFRIAAGHSSPITWYVNGIAGGNTLVGKVTGTGMYTAPANAPDDDVELTVADSSSDQKSTVAHIKVVDDPAIQEAHQRWLDGAVEEASSYGCTHPTIQQGTNESVADALKVYLLTADKSSCLILSPVSSDPELKRYSYAWGGNVDGVDIYYISDVSRPRILLGDPVAGE